MTERIKSTLAIKDVMEYYGVKFNRRGFASCPFHAEKTPSLSIKNGRFTCFGCGASGDLIEFVEMYHGLNFGQALVRINADFSLGLTNKRPNRKEMQQAREEKLIAKAAREVEKGYEARYMAVTMAFQKLFRLNNPNLSKTLEQVEEWLDANL